MDKKILKLAKKAGFVIWGEGERVGKIDWACDYDKELEKFYDLVSTVAAVRENDACVHAIKLRLYENGS